LTICVTEALLVQYFRIATLVNSSSLRHAFHEIITFFGFRENVSNRFDTPLVLDAERFVFRHILTIARGADLRMTAGCPKRLK
jgi:hypothetical protein